MPKPVMYLEADDSPATCLCGAPWIATAPNGACRCGPCLAEEAQTAPGTYWASVEWREFRAPSKYVTQPKPAGLPDHWTFDHKTLTATRADGLTVRPGLCDDGSLCWTGGWRLLADAVADTDKLRPMKPRTYWDNGNRLYIGDRLVAGVCEARRIGAWEAFVYLHGDGPPMQVIASRGGTLAQSKRIAERVVERLYPEYTPTRPKD